MKLLETKDKKLRANHFWYNLMVPPRICWFCGGSNKILQEIRKFC